MTKGTEKEGLMGRGGLGWAGGWGEGGGWGGGIRREKRNVPSHPGFEFNDFFTGLYTNVQK